MRIFTTTNLIVEAFDRNTYLWDSNFLTIKRINSGITWVKVGATGNFAQYFFYDKNSIIVDVTDRIRSKQLGVISVQIQGMNLDIDYFADNGARGLLRELLPPKRIPYFNIGQTFYVSLFMPERIGETIRRVYDDEPINVWPSLVLENPQQISMSRNMKQLTIGDFIGSTFDQTFDQTFGGGDKRYIIDFYQPRCGIEYCLLTWMGQTGGQKSWFFQKHGTIYGTSKSIDIQKNTNPDGYNMLKDKMIDIIIGHENANIITRKYLADIVLSDKVTFFDEIIGRPVPVLIDAKSYTVNEKEQDENIMFTMRYKNFRTI
jgi:hypothetical protein